MTEADESGARTLEVAGSVARILEELGAQSALIGAAALAVYGYPRATEDVDLAVATDPFSTLVKARARIAETLGVEVALSTPDADDPLGGVLTVAGPDFDPVQVVNFSNPLRAGTNPGAEAVRTARAGLVTGTSLRVVTIPYLVALKLYAGGYKAELDVLSLLERNPHAPIAAITRTCRRFGLEREWQAVKARRNR